MSSPRLVRYNIIHTAPTARYHIIHTALKADTGSYCMYTVPKVLVSVNADKPPYLLRCVFTPLGAFSVRWHTILFYVHALRWRRIHSGEVAYRFVVKLTEFRAEAWYLGLQSASDTHVWVKSSAPDNQRHVRPVHCIAGSIHA